MKILIIIFTIIILVGFYFIVGNYAYNIALSLKTSKTFVLGEDDKKVEHQELYIN